MAGYCCNRNLLRGLYFDDYLLGSLNDYVAQLAKLSVGFSRGCRFESRLLRNVFLNRVIRCLFL